MKRDNKKENILTKEKINWQFLTKKDIFHYLKTSDKGLNTNEANQRLQENGLNKLPKAKKKTFFNIFFNELKNPIIYLLLIAMTLTFIVGENIDGIFILIVILLDAILGSVQEWRSNKNAEALKELIKVEAIVLRDGIKKVISAEYLTLGDIVFIESGTKVPADLRLIETYNLSIDESILTGESLPTNKTSKVTKNLKLSNYPNIAYTGTSVMRGRGIGIVVATGINTSIGKIASEVLLTKETDSPLTIRMNKFTKQIGFIAMILALVLSIIMFAKGFIPREIFFAVVALSVSAIPEGLPVVLTLSLSIASNKMAKKNVLVKKLNAVESLGSTTVIASDKTGTLTLNEQTAKIIVLPNEESYKIKGNGYNGIGKIICKKPNKNITELISACVINNEAKLELVDKEWVSHGDSIDIAFLSLGLKAGIIWEDLKDKIVGMIPYESEQKYSAAFYKQQKQIICTVKGSLETILQFSDTMKIDNKIVPINKKMLEEQNNKLSSEGYRVLVVASGIKENFKPQENYKEIDIPRLTILGLVGFIDPIRKEVITAIKKCQNSGIKTVMITGDHPLTAYSIAKSLHMVKSDIEVTEGFEIDTYLSLGQKEFDKFISIKKVFSRVTPMQKFEIVESYKRQGEFVAVTGDGVNDAPALKAANVGIAMGSGTDVAKETSSIIITDDNFVSIVNGVEEGRIVYSNIRKVIYMLLSCAFCEIIFFLLSIALNYPIPLVAVQLLWLNLVTDGIQDAGLAFEKGEPNIMKMKPKKPNESIFDKLLVNEILFQGLIMGLIVFTLWIYLIDIKHYDITLARSCALLLMVFIQNIHVLNCRSETRSLFKIPFKDNKIIILSIVAVLILQFVVVENSFLSSVLDIVPLPLSQVFEIFCFALPILITSELFKYFERQKNINKEVKI